MIKVFSNGLLDSNTYLYYTNDKHGMIVDCGVPCESVSAFAEENGIIIDYIALTHGHYDHIDYIGTYVSAFPDAKIICHKEELALIRESDANLSLFFGTPRDYDYAYTPLENGDIITLGKENGKAGAELEVIHLPGHTMGCMCLYSEKEKIMFTGDVIFACGYGRTDFKYGSPLDMMKSLERLEKYKGVRIYPGHYEDVIL